MDSTRDLAGCTLCRFAFAFHSLCGFGLQFFRRTIAHAVDATSWPTGTPTVSGWLTLRQNVFCRCQQLGARRRAHVGIPTGTRPWPGAAPTTICGRPQCGPCEVGTDPVPAVMDQPLLGVLALSVKSADPRQVDGSRNEKGNRRRRPRQDEVFC